MSDRPKRKRKNWSEPDEIRLLGVWEESIEELKKTRKKSQIYQQMANSFPGHTAEEVHIKINNFTQRYRTERKACDEPGASPSSWKYYAIVDRILGPVTSGEQAGANYENEIFEEVTGDYTFKEEASSEVTSQSSLSPPPQSSILPPLLQQLEASFPSLRFPFVMPQSHSETQDSSISPPMPAAQKTILKRKRSHVTLQKETLKIARENQNLLREQIAFSRDAIKQQLNMISHSIELIKESTENSKNFSTKIGEISEKQLKLENEFMGFMKEIFSKTLRRRNEI